MRLEIIVHANCEYWRGGAAFVVPEPMYKAFEPMNTCDDEYLSRALNQPMPNSATAKVVMKIREDAAKKISDEITKHLILEMSRSDTHNGYPATAE